MNFFTYLKYFACLAYIVYFVYLTYIAYCAYYCIPHLNYLFSVSLLNLTEEERSKPENWIPVGWIPVYNNELSKRPGKGYESDSARCHRLMHDCLRHFLTDWNAKTEHTTNIMYGDDVCRQTRIFLGGLLGDQPVCNIFCIF